MVTNIMRVTAVCLWCFAVVACATHPSAYMPLAAPACLPLTAYPPSQQADIEKAMQALPPGSPLAGAMADYERMRDADRACLSSH